MANFFKVLTFIAILLTLCMLNIGCCSICSDAEDFQRKTLTSGNISDFAAVDNLSEGVYIIRDKDFNYGFADITGNVVISARYDYVKAFSQGMAVFAEYNRKEKKFLFGFIDKSGNTAIPAIYEQAQSFSEGLAAVKQGKKFGYIDKNATMVITPAFDDAGAFTDGMAKVVVNGKVGFINKAGNFTVAAQYFKADSFSGGMAVLCHASKCGYIDKSGKFFIEPSFDDAKSFSEGLAPVRIGNMWRYINKSGKIAFNKEFLTAESFSESLAVISIKTNFAFNPKYGGFTGYPAYGYIDTKGNFAIKPTYYHATPFSEGLAIVSIPGGCFTGDCYDQIFIDHREHKIKGKYSVVLPFKEGYSHVNTDNMSAFITKNGDVKLSFKDRLASTPSLPTNIKYGYISTDGKVKIPLVYNSANSFSEGLALIRERLITQEKYINPAGKIAITLPANTLRAQNFSDGLAAVQLHDKVSQNYGFIDKTGRFVIAPQFVDAGPFTEGMAAVSKGDKQFITSNWDYINKQGSYLTHQSFYKADPFIKGTAFVQVLIKNAQGLATIHYAFIDKTGATKLYPDDFKYYPFVYSYNQFETSQTRDIENLTIYSYTTFNEGVIPVNTVSGKTGFTDITGKMVIKPQYETAKYFSEGLAPVRIYQNWGYIDSTGKIVIKPAYDDAEPFSGGLGRVMKNGKYGYVDASGKLVIPCQLFEEAYSFHQGYALIKLNNKFGFIDKKGKIIIDPVYDAAKSFSENLAVVGLKNI